MIAYDEFLRMLTAWRRSELDGCGVSTPTGLLWEYETDRTSPFKQVDAIREKVSREPQLLTA